LNVLLLVCLVAAYCATCSGAKNTVVPGEMTGNSTNRGAFDAALRIGWGSEGEAIAIVAKHKVLGIRDSSEGLKPLASQPLAGLKVPASPRGAELPDH